MVGQRRPRESRNAISGKTAAVVALTLCFLRRQLLVYFSTSLRFRELCIDKDCVRVGERQATAKMLLEEVDRDTFKQWIVPKLEKM
jgi:hypothetical protein